MAIKSVYRAVTDIINLEMEKKEWENIFIAASMGIEYSVRFNSNISLMLNDDNGVERWVLPKEIGKHLLLDTFVKEEESNTIIFTRSYYL